MRLEVERRRKSAEERQAKVQQEDRERERALHFMKCPKCGFQALLEVRGQGVECRVSRVQGRRKAAFGRDEGRVSLHPSRQRLSRLMLRCQDRCGVRAGIDS